MSTWATLLADIRVDLKDEAATKRWSDAALYLWAKDAIRDYSLNFPQMKYSEQLTLNSGSYALPSDFLEVISVEYPAGRYLDRRFERPPQSETYPTRYYISGGRLYLDASPTGDAYLNYEAMHPVPSSATDTSFAITIPEMDEELLRLYIKGKAIEQIRSAQSNLDRFKLGSGDRDDNPLLPETNQVMRDYYNKIAERRGGGTVFLQKR